MSKPRSSAKDFLAGVDPTGTKTFHYGMEDADEATKERRAIGAVGGIIGGGLLVPMVISSIIEGAQGVASGGAKGGLKRAITGFHKPITTPIQAARTKGLLKRLSGTAGKTPISKGELKAVRGVLSNVPLVKDNLVKLTDEGMEQALKAMPAKALLKAQEGVSEQLAKYLSAISISGAIGGGSAYLQYGKGSRVGKELREKTSMMEKEAPTHLVPKKDRVKRAVNIEGGLKTATLDLLMKFAGEVDVEALKRLEQTIRAGDILQFNAQGADVARGSIRKGLQHKLISEPIQKATGSPQHHTAIYVGRDPQTGKMMLAHNFEQAGKSGVTVEPVERYGRSVKLTAYRPAGVTPEQAAAAAEEAKALAASGQTAYSKRNLVGAGLQTAAEKQEGRAGKVLGRAAQVVGKTCDPGTGICSHLPVDVYGKHLGREKALEMFAGKQVAPEAGHIAVTPATISESKALQQVGEYSPKNLEGSMRSAMKARAREKAVSMIPKLRAGIKAVTRGRVG